MSKVLGHMYKNFMGQYMVLFNDTFDITAVRVNRRYYVAGPEGQILQGQLRRRHIESWRKSTVYLEIPMMENGDYILVRAVLASDNEACLQTLKEFHEENDHFIMVPYEWDKSHSKVLVDGIHHDLINYVDEDELKTMDEDDLRKVVRTDYGQYAMISYDDSKAVKYDRLDLKNTHIANQLIIGKIWNDECTALMLNEHIRHYHLNYNDRYTAEGLDGQFYDGYLVPDADGIPKFESSHGKCFILANEGVLCVRPTMLEASGILDPSLVKQK